MPARRHVGGDEHAHAAVAQVLEREVALALAHVAVQGAGREALLAQRAGEVLAPTAWWR